MAERRPLVRINGRTQLLPLTDTLPAANAGGVQLGGSESQAMVISVNGGTPINNNDAVLDGGTPTQAGL